MYIFAKIPTQIIKNKENSPLIHHHSMTATFYFPIKNVSPHGPVSLLTYK